MYKNKFVNIMAHQGSGGVTIGETVFTCAYMGKIFFKAITQCKSKFVKIMAPGGSAGPQPGPQYGKLSLHLFI
jgi:hypothetical protein